MCYDNKSCLRVSLYVTNSLLIVKGIVWIIFIILTFALALSYVATSGDKARTRYGRAATPSPEELAHLGNLFIFSTLIFGIASLTFGIVGIIGTKERHLPTLTASAVLLILLCMAEVIVFIVLTVYRFLSDNRGFLWGGVPSAILTLVTLCLTMAYQVYIKRRSRYV